MRVLRTRQVSLDFDAYRVMAEGYTSNMKLVMPEVSLSQIIHACNQEKISFTVDTFETNWPFLRSNLFSFSTDKWLSVKSLNSEEEKQHESTSIN